MYLKAYDNVAEAPLGLDDGWTFSTSVGATQVLTDIHRIKWAITCRQDFTWQLNHRQ
jgi:hypothetical protein